MKKSVAFASLLSAVLLAAPVYAASMAEQQAVSQDKNAIHQDMSVMQQSEKNESAAHGDANKQRLAIEEHRKAILASEEKIKQHKTLAQQYLKLGNKTDAANEQKIVDELAAVQGSPVEIGGYYRPDGDAVDKVMRPSATLNGIIDALS